MDELMDQFAIEARELVQRASDDLLALEREPSDRACLESVFRAIHTLKGSVGLFDFGPMHQVLHQAEELLTGARDGTIDIDEGLIDPLIAVVEWVDRCLNAIDESGNITTALSEESQSLMSLLREEKRSADDTAPASIRPSVPEWALSILADADLKVSPDRDLVAFRYQAHPECFFSGDDPLETVSTVPAMLHLRLLPREAWPSLEAYDPFRCNLTIEGLAAVPRQELEEIFRLIPDQVHMVDLMAEYRGSPSLISQGRQAQARAAGTMRVDPARIDSLVEIAGELVTAKNGLPSLARDARGLLGGEPLSRKILSSHQEIERLVGALYAAVTKARMIPLDNMFRRFPRLVREIASRLGRSVDLTIEGGGIEADKDIVEELFEPLIHLVRNALDHGIEPEGEREAAGKQTRGVLSLRANQRADQIEIELKDDGRGIEAGHIRALAVDRGLLTPAQAAALSDPDALQLIFAAGFSTSKTVTELSGRGVGLDAVRTAIHALGGSVDLASAPGRGTSFRLLLPVSFAMSRLMIIEVEGERYGIPIEGIFETVRLRPEDIIPVRAGEAFVLRDRTVPLVRLAEVFGIKRTNGRGKDLKVLVAKAHGARVGIAVDAIAEQTQTLMRPLSGMLQGLPGIAGSTVLGDGSILLVLDVEALIS